MDERLRPPLRPPIVYAPTSLAFDHHSYITHLVCEAKAGRQHVCELHVQQLEVPKLLA